MATQSTDKKESSKSLNIWVERLLYILITLILYVVPFLAPGITEIVRIEVFFGGTIVVILTLMFYGVFDSIRFSQRARSQAKRRYH